MIRWRVDPSAERRSRPFVGSPGVAVGVGCGPAGGPVRSLPGVLESKGPNDPWSRAGAFRSVEHMFEVFADELEEVVERIAACGVPVDGAALVRLRGVVDRLEALTCEAQVRFDECEAWRDEGAGSLRGWLAEACGLGRRRASESARRSERLESWPVVREAWIAGRLSGAQVDAVVAVVPSRFVARFADDAAMVVDVIAPLDVAGTEAALRQWVRCAEADDGAEQLVERPSGVFVSSYFDGRLAISGELSPAEGAIVEAALRVFDVPDQVDEHGDEHVDVVGERRSMARRNADALVAMAQFALDHRDGGGEIGRFVPHVSLVIDVTELRAAALRGADVHTVADVRRRSIERGWSEAETAWFTEALSHHGDGVTAEGQMLDAAAISALSCDSVVQRVMMSGSRVLDLGREVRTARHWQRRAVIARDRHCRAPGCRTKPRFCDVHHVDHWIEGGRTDVDRMVLLCGTHHREFHKDGYRMEFDADGVFTVHSPRGWSRSTVPTREATYFPLATV